MRHPKPLAAAVFAVVLLAPGGAPADGPAVTVAECLRIFDRAPVSEFRLVAHPWSKVPDAARICVAVSHVATSREQATEMEEWGTMESGLHLNAVGDHGRSHGWLQISIEQLPPEKARDPEIAARTWLALAAKSAADCAALPPDEQRAQLASGNCQSGHELSARRAKILRWMLDALTL